MKELHLQGTKIEDIVAVLKRTPIHPRIIQAIKSAHALGYCLQFSLSLCFLSGFLATKILKVLVAMPLLISGVI